MHIWYVEGATAQPGNAAADIGVAILPDNSKSKLAILVGVTGETTTTMAVILTEMAVKFALRTVTTIKTETIAVITKYAVKYIA